MHHLIYSSTATHPFSEQELQELLIRARAHNTQHGLTGILLYYDGQFVQLLEGPAHAVASLYDRIGRDPRHTGVIKLADKQVADRSFPDWSMAFQVLDKEQYAQLQGYESPAEVNFSPAGLSAADTMLLGLMRTFMHRDTPDNQTS